MDEIDIQINDVALRSFRDMADREYILARMAFITGLYPQFRWSAAHTIEKYLKSIILLRRIENPRSGHCLLKLVNKIGIENLNLTLDLLDYIRYLDESFSQDRYLQWSWSVNLNELYKLDSIVWALWKTSNPALYKHSKESFIGMNDSYLLRILSVNHLSNFPDEFSVGFISTIVLKDKNFNESKKFLILDNPFFSEDVRPIKELTGIGPFENSPLTLYSDLINTIAKYIYIPGFNKNK